MEDSIFSSLEVVRHLSPASERLRTKYIENADYDATLRCSTGETIIGRDLESTLNDPNARELLSKKFSDLWVQPFWWKTTFCEPEKSIINIHFQPKWSKLY